MSLPDDEKNACRHAPGASAAGGDTAPAGATAEPGSAQQIAEFSRPLLEGANTPESVQNALLMGSFFWKLALSKDVKSREERLEFLLKTLAQSDTDREALRDLACKMKLTNS